MKLAVFIVLIWVSSSLASGQNMVPPKAMSQINSLLADENYPKAIEEISKIKNQYPNDARLELKLGFCYLNSPTGLQDALAHLEKAVKGLPVKGKTTKDGIEANFYYGQAFHRLERFLEAKQVFESLRNQIPPRQKQLLARIDKELQMAQNAIELSLNPVIFKITNLGPQINTPYDEHSPLVDDHESLLIFTSNHQGVGEGAPSNALHNEDIYVSKFLNNEWQKAQSIGRNVNTEGNNATVSLIDNGKSLIIYQHDGISGDLYVTNKIGDEWSVPEKMPAPITTSYNETHGCFSADGNTFFFTSDRPGGYGKRDIYWVRKLPDGQWGKPQNLGAAVNTEGNEESPFIAVDGKTLYFASTEHKTIGGYDIFKSTLNDTLGWSTPENIGYPINTPGDDLFFNPSADGTRVYYASQRKGGFGGSDLYLVEFAESDPRSFAVVSGYVFDAQKRPFAEVSITLYDADSDETIGFYKPNATTGKYVMIVPGGKKYKVVYLTANNTYEKAFAISSRQSYESGNWAHYLDPLIVEGQP